MSSQVFVCGCPSPPPRDRRTSAATRNAMATAPGCISPPYDIIPERNRLLLFKSPPRERRRISNMALRMRHLVLPAASRDRVIFCLAPTTHRCHRRRPTRARAKSRTSTWYIVQDFQPRRWIGLQTADIVDAKGLNRCPRNAEERGRERRRRILVTGQARAFLDPHVAHLVS